MTFLKYFPCSKILRNRLKRKKKAFLSKIRLLNYISLGIEITQIKLNQYARTGAQARQKKLV